MHLETALKIVKKEIKNLIEPTYFKEKIIDRGIDIRDVKSAFKKNKVVGILNQNDKEKIYKIWLLYIDDKDLCIIIKIFPDKKIRGITIFPEASERRKKK